MQEVVYSIKGSKITLIPLMSTGATDARFFRKAFGTQAYGFAVFDDLLDLDTIRALFHGDDERISVASLDMTARAYKELAKKFLA